MKYFALLLVALVAGLAVNFSALAAAPDLEKVPLLLNNSYDPRSEEGRDFYAFTSSFTLATFGQLYMATTLDVEKDILAKLNQAEIKVYFPSEKERLKIARTISEKINTKYLNNSLTNKNVAGAIQYAANELVGDIIQRALEKEGVKSPERRALWSKKILAPFNTCVKATKTYSEANRCLEALQADSLQNVGQAVVYELSFQETNPAIAAASATNYRKCLKVEKGKSVRVCALQGMRGSVLSYGMQRAEAVANENVPSATAGILKTIRAPLQACLGKAIDRKDFLQCGDAFTLHAGSEMVYATVLANPQVKQALAPSQAEELAKRTQKQFQSCLAEPNQTRGANGLLVVKPCVNFVRLEATKKVAETMFQKGIASVEGVPSETKDAILSSTLAQLNACWDSQASEAKNSQCMRSSILKLSQTLASEKLDRKLPEGLKEKEPKLKERLVGNFYSCLNKQLPENVLGNFQLKKEFDLCGGNLLRDSALKVASYSLQDALVGNVRDKNLIQSMDAKLVQKDFNQCLGKTPSDTKVEECSFVLKEKAGYEVGKVLFSEGYQKYLADDGGLSSFGVEEKDKNSFLALLMDSHKKCLAKAKSSESETFLTTCFKASIHDLARELAGLKFKKKAKSYVPESQIEGLNSRFVREFDTCLDEKAPASFSIKDYLGQIDVCTSRLTGKYTIEVARVKVHSSIEEFIPTKEELAQKKNQEIENSLLTDFTSCAENNEMDACTKQLEKKGVLLIVQEATRREVGALFGPNHPDLTEIETQLQECGRNEDVDSLCAKKHIITAAKKFGPLKVDAELSAVLGQEMKQASSEEIKKMQGEYFACLDKLFPQKLDANFLHNIHLCSSALEMQATNLVQLSFKNWLKHKNSTPKELTLNEKIALSLPCFDKAFTTPDKSMGDIDPDGILRELASLIGTFIDYDVDQADLDFDAIVAQLASDMESAGPMQARENLLKLLVERGAADRLLKSLVRAQVEKQLKSLPKEEQLPKEAQKALLNKEILEKALSKEQMARLSPLLVEKILKPLLLEGKSLKGKEQKMAAALLEHEVADSLLNSQEFGNTLVTATIQDQINKSTQGWIFEKSLSTWFFNSVVGYSYDWSELRKTKDGKKAEDYIRNEIIAPRIRGENISEQEMLKRKQKASELVTEAVKNQ